LAEVHTTGSPPVLGLLLAHCLARGARPAEPGEFTLRAFLSGRLDLTRAEAVLGVIDARNPAQLDAALRQLAGGLFGPIAALRDRLLDVLAHLEANLDFVDEPDVDPLGRAELAEGLARASAEVSALADRLRARDRPDGHPRVVLVGPPNAGKSRLFNALLGDARAIVSPVPGTTRDYLAASCDCDGLTVALIDTAGAEAARNPVEARAQALRHAQAARADLLLDCLPADRPDGDPGREPISEDAVSPDRPRLSVRTKADLAPDAPAAPGVWVTSAATGAGLAALRRAVASALRELTDEGELPATTGARCRDSLARASESLASASATLALGGGDELVAVDLRLALDELGKVVGAVVTDDFLDRIFRRFCIGK
jgi:tRNA modification GTPase